MGAVELNGLLHEVIAGADAGTPQIVVAQFQVPRRYQFRSRWKRPSILCRFPIRSNEEHPIWYQTAKTAAVNGTPARIAGPVFLGRNGTF